VHSSEFPTSSSKTVSRFGSPLALIALLLAAILVHSVVLNAAGLYNGDFGGCTCRGRLGRCDLFMVGEICGVVRFVLPELLDEEGEILFPLFCRECVYVGGVGT